MAGEGTSTGSRSTGGQDAVVAGGGLRVIAHTANAAGGAGDAIAACW